MFLLHFHSSYKLHRRLFVFILLVLFVFYFGNFGIFRLSLVSIDCRFIAVFAIASCHDRMTLFRSRYSSERFPFVFRHFYFYCWIILNAWCEVSFSKSINHCGAKGEFGTQKNDREKTGTTNSKHISPQIMYVNWVCLPSSSCFSLFILLNWWFSSFDVVRLQLST